MYECAGAFVFLVRCYVYEQQYFTSPLGLCYDGRSSCRMAIHLCCEFAQSNTFMDWNIHSHTRHHTHIDKTWFVQRIQFLTDICNSFHGLMAWAHFILRMHVCVCVWMIMMERKAVSKWISIYLCCAVLCCAVYIYVYAMDAIDSTAHAVYRCVYVCRCVR